jgi:hypothetical protein
MLNQEWTGLAENTGQIYMKVKLCTTANVQKLCILLYTVIATLWVE